MLYDWYLKIKFKMEKKKYLHELELEKFIRDNQIKQQKLTCEHSYEQVGFEEKSRLDKSIWEWEKWTEHYLYCPKCDKTLTVNKSEANRLLEQQRTRDEYNSNTKGE